MSQPATQPATLTEWGVIAEFESPAALLKAAAAANQHGFRKFECYSPFAIHGIEKAMGMRPTHLPWISLAGGIAGFFGALAFQYWANDPGTYYTIISGKPDGLQGLPGFAIITFVATILSTGIATLVGFFALNDMPKFYDAVFTHGPFKRVTDDKFFLAISAEDGRYAGHQTKDFLIQIGGKDVTIIKD